MNKDEALKMAIEFMDGLGVDKCNCHWWEEERIEAIKACKEALASNIEALEQPEQSACEECGMKYCECGERK